MSVEVLQRSAEEIEVQKVCDLPKVVQLVQRTSSAGMVHGADCAQPLNIMVNGLFCFSLTVISFYIL